MLCVCVQAEDKYQFFLEATQLEWLRETLAHSLENIKDMENTVKAQREKIPDLDKKIAQLQSAHTQSTEKQGRSQQSYW